MKLFIKNRKGQRIAVVVDEATPQKGLSFVMYALAVLWFQKHL